MLAIPTRKALGLATVSIVLAAVLAPTITAVHADGFELEGNAADDTGGAEDWGTLFPVSGSTTSTHRTFISEALGDSTYFTSGGSKDVNDIPSWRATKTDVAPDKDEILHAFAALFGSKLYYGSDRYGTDGTADMGYWFFQKPVTVKPDGTFSGGHVDNDILIVAEYTNGGAVTSITVYKWLAGKLVKHATGQECGGAATDALCARANTKPEASPWAYKPKSGAENVFPTSAFFEGGIDLARVIPNVKCFSSFLAETRSSVSPTAQLKDFALGTFRTCAATIDITPVTSVNPVGSRHEFTAHVTRDLGEGPEDLQGQLVNFTLVGGPGTFEGPSQCTTDAAGSCSILVNATSAGTTTIRAYADVLLGNAIVRVITGSEGNGADATKAWVDALITITPPFAVNPVGTTHDLLVHVAKNEGRGWADAAGAHVVGTILTPIGSWQGPSACDTDAAGNCTLTIASNVAGTTIVQASTDIVVGGVTLTRTTGTSGNSANAEKRWEEITPPIVTTPSASSIVFGGSVTDHARVTGDVGPATGEVQFFVCAKDVVPCDINVATPLGGRVPLNATGEADSVPFTPNGAGTWCFAARYFGDATYAPADGTLDRAECFLVVPATPLIVTLASLATVALGEGVTDHATVIGVPAPLAAPEGTVSFYVCGPAATGACETGGTLVSTETLEAGEADSDAYVAEEVGRYCFRAEYSGDANYESVSHTDAAVECFLVLSRDAATCTAQAITLALGTSRLATFRNWEALASVTASATPTTGDGYGEAHQAGAGVTLPALGPGALDATGLSAECRATADSGATAADGVAEVQRMTLDVTIPGTTLDAAPGVRVTMSLDTLREAGHSDDGFGWNQANIVNLAGVIEGIPYAASAGPADKDHVIDLATVLGVHVDVGYIVLNEQIERDEGDCTTNIGNAMRVVLYDPLVTPLRTALELNVSHVEVRTCGGTNGPPSGGTLASCDAFGLKWSVSPASLAPLAAHDALSPSRASAGAPSGAATGAARQVNVDIVPGVAPGTLHSDTLGSTCGADGARTGAGTARAENLTLDLAIASITVNITTALLNTSVTHAAGSSQLAAVDVKIGSGAPTRVAPNPAPNTVIELKAGTLLVGRLYLNEQAADACGRASATALRLVLYDSLAGATPHEAANVTVSHVEVDACPEEVGAAAVIASVTVVDSASVGEDATPASASPGTSANASTPEPSPTWTEAVMAPTMLATDAARTLLTKT